MQRRTGGNRGTYFSFFYDDYGFQTIFISLLIVSAVLGVNRKQLIKAFGGYIPAIFGGIILSAILGIGAAALCGVDIKAAVTLYVLPIMGGGNGSGGSSRAISTRLRQRARCSRNAARSRTRKYASAKHSVCSL